MTEDLPVGANSDADVDDHSPGIESYLKAHGKLNEADLAKAQHLASEGRESVAVMLVRMGMISERNLMDAFAKSGNIPLVEADDYPAIPLEEENLSLRFMKEVQAVPIRLDDGVLVVAVVDPSDDYVRKAIEVATGYQVQFEVGVASEIESAIERLYGSGRSVMGEIVDGLVDSNEHEEDVEHLKDLASEAPVIRLVNLIVQRAVESRASDIHVEPFEERLKVRYRVDGVLSEAESPPLHSTAAIISRIKIMAKLNIAERRLPQDGRITVRVQGKELDLRVSTVPTLFGESVVIRLLDKESVTFDFEALGFDGVPLERMKGILDFPHGIVLVTGPTGSGKSTTLYTALHRLNTPSRKIITVEDPVEYQLEGINQIQVKAQIDLTFANALRAIVRQDPDVIMVGEMRDLETARIAVQSALTGHLVLSTLHTNTAAGSVTRLLDMGVDDYLITSTVNGILAQRLVRRLCPHCKEPYPAMPELVKELDLGRFVSAGEEIRLYRAVGCEHCGSSGYYGRLSLTEVLIMSDKIRQLVMQHANAGEIHHVSVAEGMNSLYQDGLRKAVAGRTTIEEVMRVAEDE
jgi:general secretion pathway protein E